MIVFLDFEASSLSKKSYPIEVGWVFEDGRSASWLIRPAPEWTDWSAQAEAIHGLPRAQLLREGAPVAEVADAMIAALSGHDLYVSAPSWDGKWLSVLLRAAGMDRHALRLKKSDEAFVEAARKRLPGTVSGKEAAAFVRGVVQALEGEAKPAHRALADAQMELRRLQAVCAAAETLAVGEIGSAG